MRRRTDDGVHDRQEAARCNGTRARLLHSLTFRAADIVLVDDKYRDASPEFVLPEWRISTVASRTESRTSPVL